MTKLENILHTHDDSDKMTNDRIDKLEARVAILESLLDEEDMALYLQLLSEVE